MRFDVRGVDVDLVMAGDRIAAHLEAGDGYEPETLATWVDICGSAPSHAVVIDVGAYSGLFAIIAAKLGCTVYAFEPNPRMFGRASINIRLNEVSVSLSPLALSDSDGEAMLHHNPNSILTTAASLEPRSNKTASIKVRTGTLDFFCLADVRAMKIDVERHEPAVLRGAKETIARCRPAIVAEALEPAFRRAVLAELPGYRIDRVMDRRNILLMDEKVIG